MAGAGAGEALAAPSSLSGGAGSGGSAVAPAGDAFVWVNNEHVLAFVEAECRLMPPGGVLNDVAAGNFRTRAAGSGGALAFEPFVWKNGRPKFRQGSILNRGFATSRQTNLRRSQ